MSFVAQFPGPFRPATWISCIWRGKIEKNSRNLSIDSTWKFHSFYSRCIYFILKYNVLKKIYENNVVASVEKDPYNPRRVKDSIEFELK